MTANEYITKISKLMTKFEKEYPEEFAQYLDTVYKTKSVPQIVKDANELVVETESALQVSVIAYALEHQEPIPIGNETRDLILHYLDNNEVVNKDVYELIFNMDPGMFIQIFGEFIKQTSTLTMEKLEQST